MRRRRSWLGWSLLVVAAGFGTRWLLSPVPEETPGADTSVMEGRGSTGLAARPGRPQGTRLDAFVAWLRRRIDSASDDFEDPPMPLQPAPALGEPGTLEVEAREEGGPPVIGARVLLFGPPGAPRRSTESTGADGLVTFRDLPSAKGYLVSARVADAYGTTTWVEDRSVTVRPRETTRLVLQRPGFRVHGVVLDAAARSSVAGAQVEAGPVGPEESDAATEDALGVRCSPQVPPVRPAPPVAETLTDDEGRFALELGGASGAQIRVRTSDGRSGLGYASRATSDRPLEVLVGPPSTCGGVVVDPDGRPCAGVRISVLRARGCVSVPAAAVTGTDGRFRVEVPQSVARSASAPPTVTILLEGDEIPTFTTRMKAGAEARIVVPGRSALEVHVVKDDTGAPAAGARILCVGASWTTEGATSADGRARVAMPAGEIQSLEVAADDAGALVLSRGDVARGTLDPPDALVAPLGEGEIRPVTVRLPRGIVLAGRVRHADGRAAAGVPVVCYGGRVDVGNSPVPRGRSREDGAFRVAGVTPPPPPRASVLLVGGLDGEGTFRLPVAIDPAAARGRPIDVGDVLLPGEARLRLHVVDPDGKPVPAMSMPSGSWGTSEEGVLVRDLLDLEMGRPLSIDLEARGFRTRTVRLSADLSPGEVRDVGPIRMERATPLDVRVLDADARPSAGCLLAWEGWSRDHTAVTTDADGRASLPGLATPDEDLSVTLPDGAKFVRWGRLPVDGGAGVPVDLRVPPLRALEVRVASRSGAPLGSGSVSIGAVVSPGFLTAAERWGRLDSAGVARFTSVVATPAALTVHAQGFVTQRVHLDAAATAVAVALVPIDEASETRLRQVLADLERVEAEIASNPSDEGEAARARFRRKLALEEERESLLGR